MVLVSVVVAALVSVPAFSGESKPVDLLSAKVDLDVHFTTKSVLWSADTALVQLIMRAVGVGEQNAQNIRMGVQALDHSNGNYWVLTGIPVGERSGLSQLTLEARENNKGQPGDLIEVDGHPMKFGLSNLLSSSGYQIRWNQMIKKDYEVKEGTQPFEMQAHRLIDLAPYDEITHIRFKMIPKGNRLYDMELHFVGIPIEGCDGNVTDISYYVSADLSGDEPKMYLDGDPDKLITAIDLHGYLGSIFDLHASGLYYVRFRYQDTNGYKLSKMQQRGCDETYDPRVKLAAQSHHEEIICTECTGLPFSEEDLPIQIEGLPQY